MANLIELFQGSDLDIVVKHDDASLATASEIECVINTTAQIIKTLSAGDISGVTASEFTVRIEDTDTASKSPGEYLIQVRQTNAAGDIVHGDMSPKKVKIIDSVFSNTA